jgi:hypothetical protein
MALPPLPTVVIPPISWLFDPPFTPLYSSSSPPPLLEDLGLWYLDLFNDSEASNHGLMDVGEKEGEGDGVG